MSSETRTSLVRDARKGLDLRLVDVADIAGVSVSMLSMIEHGYTPSKGTRDKVAPALRSTPEALWPEEYA